jgi:hypothetical protein
MCSVLSFAYLLIYISIGGGFVAGAWCQGRFMGRLTEHHPKTWHALTQKKVFFDDGDQHGAVASRYLLSGGYKTLGDETLNSFARQGWLAVGLVALASVAWLLVHFFAPDTSLLACIRR